MSTTTFHTAAAAESKGPAPVKICKNVITPEGCTFGTACRFPHPMSIDAAIKECALKPGELTICSNGRCRNPTTCRFLHLGVLPVTNIPAAKQRGDDEPERARPYKSFQPRAKPQGQAQSKDRRLVASHPISKQTGTLRATFNCLLRKEADATAYLKGRPTSADAKEDIGKISEATAKVAALLAEAQKVIDTTLKAFDIVVIAEDAVDETSSVSSDTPDVEPSDA